MPMQIRPILRGLKSYLLRNPNQRGTGGTSSARYCYSVWLRHLVQASLAGVDANPATVAELGPGDSLGIGLAALLTGVDEYHGLDVVEHASSRANLLVLDELAALIRQRTPIPGPDEFPEIRPVLEDYAFPDAILTESRLERSLRPERVDAIRAAIVDPGGARDSPIRIGYTVPWHDPGLIKPASVQMIYSQATLEHVEDLDNTYRAMSLWLAPGGIMTHQVDFKSHGMTRAWNGHWQYPAAIWKLVKGRRAFLLNRFPWSTHLAHLRASGFEILRIVRHERHDGLPVRELATPFNRLSEEDAVTAGAFVVVGKPR